MVLSCRILVVLALLATVASTLRVYPHQLAYFNEASGGPETGDRLLTGSNLDWGQAVVETRDWMNAHPECRPFFIALNPPYDVTDIGLTPAIDVASDGAIRQPFPENAVQQDVNSVGWLALSRNFLYRNHLFPKTAGRPEIISWMNLQSFSQRQPDVQLGYAINVYRFRLSEIVTALESDPNLPRRSHELRL